MKQLAQETHLVKTISTKLWNKAKFIFSDSDLDFGGAIATIILNDFQMSEDSKEEFWERAKIMTKRNLNQKRNTVCTAIKKNLVGKSEK